MHGATSTESDPRKLGALADYLLENPAALEEQPSQVAQRLGIEPEVVKSAFAILAKPEGEPPSPILRDSTEILLKSLRKTKTNIAATLRRTMRDPLRFLLTTGYLALGLLLAFGLAARVPELAPALPLAFSIVMAVGVLVAALHIACLFRHGMVRYALYSALWHTPVACLLIVVLFDFSGTPLWLDIGVVAVVSLMIAGIYAAIGTVSAVLGGFAKLRQEDSQRRRMSRQQLLDRMLEIRSRLGTPEAAADRDRRGERLRRLRESARYYPVVGLLAGVVTAMVQVLILGSFYEYVEIQPSVEALLQLTVFLVALTILAIVTFAAGGVRQALVTAFMVMVARYPVYFVPLGIYGEGFVRSRFEPAQLLSAAALHFGVGLIMGIGATIEHRAVRSRELSRDEPGRLVAEYVTLQRRLFPRSQAVCVMSVDVAGSMAMKAANDPFLVEWSFREYQDAVQRVVSRNGGEVLSVAGDGTVATFHGCQDAIASAKALHRELARFNAGVNRLPLPFRVRIGLHSGSVQGQIGEVQFAEVIDIAAHVQAAAPSGAIVLTESVHCELPDERAARMAEQVDGQEVFVLLNPDDEL